jgi:phosphoglycolate phosphatase-like HAD superfamily hydrolase
VIRLVLFDVDGTLIVTGGVGVRAFARTLATQFGVANGTDGIRFAGRTDPSLVREMFLRHGIEPSPENVRRFFEAYVFILDHLLESSTGGPLPGVREWLTALRAQASPPALGLLTGNIRLGAEIKLRRFGLWDLFETGAFGDDHIDRNQIAVVARQRGERLLGRDLAGAEVVVVGDTPHDITCGKHVGARVLAVATGPHPVSDLRQHGPDWAVSDLRQVSMDELSLGT